MIKDNRIEFVFFFGAKSRVALLSNQHNWRLFCGAVLSKLLFLFNVFLIFFSKSLILAFQ